MKSDFNKPQKSFEYWTKKEFLSLPSRGWNEDIGEFDSLVIIPTNKLHDSGFWNMDFVAIRGNEPICLLSGCSDVIHIDGTGGYGNWLNGLPDLVSPKGWRIDCLKKSKLLRLFSDGRLKVSAALSSIDVYSTNKITNK